MNIPGRWNTARDAVQKANDEGFTFGNRPWFLGEMAFDPAYIDADAMRSDFQEMGEAAQSEDSLFQGFGFFQFQTAYWKDGDYEKGFGMLGLGDKELGRVSVCNEGGFYFFPNKECKEWPINCLTVPKNGTYGFGRAAVVAQAWGGDLTKVKTCDCSGPSSGSEQANSVMFA